jgi:hypothetical protein
MKASLGEDSQAAGLQHGDGNGNGYGNGYGVGW